MSFSFNRKGTNVIISAPSGAGKSTLIQRLLQDCKELEYSISATTRPKRPAEIEGVNYHFKTKEEFLDLIKKDAFIEYAEVFGNYYGTLIETIQSTLNKGKDIVFDVDWQGASKLLAKMPEDSISIFVLPPSIAEVEKRIKLRAQDSEEVIRGRIATAKSEISHYYQYDYIVLNDELEDALTEIKSIISANRLRCNKLVNIKDFIGNM